MTPYYDEGGITIYHGDCRDVLPIVSADVLITDPPYGVNLGFHHGAAENRRRHVLVKGPYLSYDDSPENFAAIVVPAIRAAIDRTKRGVVFCSAQHLWLLPQADALGGVFLPAAVGRCSWGFCSFSYAALYGKAPNLHLGCKAIGIASSATDSYPGHPCAKPESWMRWAINLACDTEESVIDPFMGSGTTLRAAKDLGRRAIGIEIEERYCEMAARRLSQGVLELRA